jgi:hypothetical protein
MNVATENLLPVFLGKAPFPFFPPSLSLSPSLSFAILGFEPKASCMLGRPFYHTPALILSQQCPGDRETEGGMAEHPRT